MKAVLVMSTALGKSFEYTKWQQPLGLAYIAASVRDISEVSIIDCEVDQQYTKTLMKEIDTDDQLVVGFSANTYSYRKALQLAELVKKHNPEAHINFGGYHVTPLANLVLKNRDYIDSVIRGDGEVPFRQLLLALSNGTDLSKVGSLTFRSNNRIISTQDAPLPDLDSLPYPARDLLPMSELLHNFRHSVFYNLGRVSRMIFVNANRGCPGACNYCSIFNRKLRRRNPDKIIDEFEMLQQKYNADSFYLIGDNLNYEPKWLMSLCDKLIARKMDIRYVAVSACANRMSNNLIDRLAKSGCINISLSFESGSQDMLDSLNKKIFVRNFDRIIKHINARNVGISASFVLGCPGESDITLDKTLKFIRKHNFDRVAASILAPLPGSTLYTKMLDIMPELRYMDLIPMDDVKKIYVSNYCYVGFEKLQWISDEIEKIAKRYDLY